MTPNRNHKQRKGIVLPAVDLGQTKSTTKPPQGSYVVTLGKIDWSKQDQKLYVHVALNGSEISPCPAICLDKESEYYGQQLGIYQSLLTALNISQRDFQTALAYDAKSFHGRAVMLTIKVFAGNASLHKKEARFYSFSPVQEGGF